MPAFAPIAILDGASTPVSHTYAPVRIDANGVALLQERVGGVPVGYPTMTWSVRPPTSQGSTYKVTCKLVIPKVVTTTDSTGKTVTSVDYSNQVETIYTVSQRSTQQERKDIRVLNDNLQNHAVAQAIVEYLESIY